jgi:hypothetical protein
MPSTYTSNILKLLVYFYGAKQILQYDQRKINSAKAQWIGLLGIVQLYLNCDP